jgi:hypothetical protein
MPIKKLRYLGERIARLRRRKTREIHRMRLAFVNVQVGFDARAPQLSVDTNRIAEQ